jgi:hypothetical protein
MVCDDAHLSSQAGSSSSSPSSPSSPSPRPCSRSHEQVTAKRTQLAHFEGILQRYADQPELASRVLLAELGARVSRTAAEFWEDVVERQSRADTDAA